MNRDNENNKKPYLIEIEQCGYKNVLVYADSEFEAEEIAQDAYADGEIDMYEYSSVTFRAFEPTKTDLMFLEEYQEVKPREE